MKLELAMMGSDFTARGEEAARIEKQGLDCGVIFESSRDPFLQVLLAAQGSSRLEIATGVAIAFARSPMIVAQTASDLQALSRGRFVLGLGSQVKAHIEKRFSMPWSRPAARMREFVSAIRAIWHAWETGEKLEFRGELYTHTLMTPMFSQGPNPFGLPPIFVAGVGPKMIEVAGEVGDGMYIHPLNTPSFLTDLVLPSLHKGFAVGGRQRKLCVHRKGATRAYPGQPVLIPGDMGRYSYVMVGTATAMAETFGSACHGAGRLMSRSEAKRSVKGRSLINEMRERGVHVMAAGMATVAEEMPEAYKDVADVVNVVHGAGVATRVAQLRPLGVIKG